MTTIADNLQEVRARIDAACEAVLRPAAQVHLLAVSKTFGTNAVAAAAASGQIDFGENYLQEAVDKIAATQSLRASTGERLRWHCIGPIQSNKTKLVAQHFDWAHTVDRLKIAQRLSEQRPDDLAPLQVCIQVNIDGSASKAGVRPEEALALVRAVAPLQRLTLRGIMTIPETAPDFEAMLLVHTRARALFDALKADGGVGLDRFDTLSMGMSGDLEAAIRAGSTIVRVGSAIFGARRQPAAEVAMPLGTTAT